MLKLSSSKLSNPPRLPKLRNFYSTQVYEPDEQLATRHGHWTKLSHYSRTNTSHPTVIYHRLGFNNPLRRSWMYWRRGNPRRILMSVSTEFKPDKPVELSRFPRHVLLLKLLNDSVVKKEKVKGPQYQVFKQLEEELSGNVDERVGQLYKDLVNQIELGTMTPSLFERCISILMKKASPEKAIEIYHNYLKVLPKLSQGDRGRFSPVDSILEIMSQHSPNQVPEYLEEAIKRIPFNHDRFYSTAISSLSKTDPILAGSILQDMMEHVTPPLRVFNDLMESLYQIKETDKAKMIYELLTSFYIPHRGDVIPPNARTATILLKNSTSMEQVKKIMKDFVNWKVTSQQSRLGNVLVETCHRLNSLNGLASLQQWCDEMRWELDQDAKKELIKILTRQGSIRRAKTMMKNLNTSIPLKTLLIKAVEEEELEELDGLLRELLMNPKSLNQDLIPIMVKATILLDDEDVLIQIYKRQERISEEMLEEFIKALHRNIDLGIRVLKHSLNTSRLTTRICKAMLDSIQSSKQISKLGDIMPVLITNGFGKLPRQDLLPIFLQLGERCNLSPSISESMLDSYYKTASNVNTGRDVEEALGILSSFSMKN